jgi:hypothetical protein
VLLLRFFMQAREKDKEWTWLQSARHAVVEAGARVKMEAVALANQIGDAISPQDATSAAAQAVQEEKKAAGGGWWSNPFKSLRQGVEAPLRAKPTPGTWSSGEVHAELTRVSGSTLDPSPAAQLHAPADDMWRQTGRGRHLPIPPAVRRHPLEPSSDAQQGVAGAQRGRGGALRRASFIERASAQRRVMGEVEGERASTAESPSSSTVLILKARASEEPRLEQSSARSAQDSASSKATEL